MLWGVGGSDKRIHRCKPDVYHRSKKRAPRVQPKRLCGSPCAEVLVRKPLVNAYAAFFTAYTRASGRVQSGEAGQQHVTGGGAIGSSRRAPSGREGWKRCKTTWCPAESRSAEAASGKM
eukprot:5552380-Pleurochrysis_carterae.AAC.1